MNGVSAGNKNIDPNVYILIHWMRLKEFQFLPEHRRSPHLKSSYGVSKHYARTRIVQEPNQQGRFVAQPNQCILVR